MILRIGVRHGIKTVFGAQAHTDTMRRPYRGYIIQNVVEQAHTVLDIAAVSIHAMITAIAQELINDVSIGTMDFHAIKTRLSGQFGAVSELHHNVPDFICF